MILYFAWSHVRSLQTDNDANDIAIDRIKGIYSKKGLFLSPRSEQLKGFLIIHISRYSVLLRLHYFRKRDCLVKPNRKLRD